MRTFVCIITIILSYFSFAQSNLKYESIAKRKSFFTQIAKQYNSTAVQEILIKDSDNSFEDYLDGYDEKSLIECYGTIIHELLHGYNTTANNGHYYFINTDCRLFVPYSGNFKSTELNKIVRPGLQDSIFRYGLYVGGKQMEASNNSMSMVLNKDAKSTVASIEDGIFGLLEEFNAYYYGCRAEFELYDYYKLNYKDNNKEAWGIYRHGVMSDILAYYEFNLFMAWYLEYAKKHEPIIYQNTIDNQALKVTYTLLDQQYLNLIKEANIKIDEIDMHIGKDQNFTSPTGDSDKEIMAFFKSMGMDINALEVEEITITNGDTTRKMVSMEVDEELMEEFREEYRNIKSQLNSQNIKGLDFFHSNPSLQIELLKKELSPYLKSELNKLKITGLTSENYKQFLK